MKIKPWRAWRPRPDVAARVAALPYDVVDTAEARALAADNPYSYLHVSRAEIDLPDGTDPHADAAYSQARLNLEVMQKQGLLVQEPQPVFFLYRLTMEGRSQVGFAACCAVVEYERGVIKTHETTRRDKEDDRTRHIEQLNANTEPVFIAFRDDPHLARMARLAQEKQPLYDFIAPDGIAHALWRLDETTEIVRAFAGVPAAYIADGHHRAAAAARVARTRRKAGDRAAAGAEYDWFMAALFPASQLRILPYNRCVRDLNGLSAGRFFAAVRERFVVQEGVGSTPAGPGRIGMYWSHTWYELSGTFAQDADLLGRLDVSVLQDRLLAPVLGISDPRTDPRIEFIGGIRGVGELVQRVERGQAAVAFSMYPTQVEQMMSIADAGLIMPPKSTWFEPKLRSGLFVHTF